MVKTPDSNRRNDDIDLLQLLLKIISTFRSNLLLIIIFFVIGTSLGAAYFMATKKQFENRMIISSSILTNSYAKILFENATTHIQEGDYPVLASDLKIPVETAKEIASLRIENLTRTEAGEIKESERYLVTAYVYDQTILQELQRGLLDYLENNEFVKIRVEQNRIFLKQMIASIDRELSDMQQFKADIYSGKFFELSKGNIMFDPTSVNTKLIELTEKRIDYQNRLELINSVQLIEGFTPFKHHKTPTLAVSIFAGSMFGLFAVGALIAFKSIRHLLRMAEAKDSKNAA